MRMIFVCGRTGDSYDNALAESVIGLYKTEEIHRRGPWKGVEDEFERAYYDRQPAPAGLAVLT